MYQLEGNDEKNIQLLLMRQVYEKTNSTTVWLGTEKEECEKALELIHKFPRSLLSADNDMGRTDLNPC